MDDLPPAVALRKESVDRNRGVQRVTGLPSVALRKESVDRNVAQNGIEAAAGGSLSARRAWIEIGLRSCRLDCRPRSLSARRAWIEIQIKDKHPQDTTSRSPQGERG